MKARHVIVFGATLAALAGCSSGASSKPVAAPAAKTTAATPEQVNPSASVDPGSDPGTLDATAAYLTALGKVDQKLITDKRAALDHGQAVCVDIEERRTDAVQEQNVATNFAVTPAQAKQILTLTKQNLCLQ